eukprot:1160395-Pelagomonas_calceolata.AAC.5
MAIAHAQLANFDTFDCQHAHSYARAPRNAVNTWSSDGQAWGVAMLTSHRLRPSWTRQLATASSKQA